jgi:hypothetical protein
MVDQRVSLGIAGDVFEVMAQVDRRLTKVNTVDPLIRANTPAENLGRHISASLGTSTAVVGSRMRLLHHQTRAHNRHCRRRTSDSGYVVVPSSISVAVHTLSGGLCAGLPR